MKTFSFFIIIAGFIVSDRKASYLMLLQQNTGMTSTEMTSGHMWVKNFEREKLQNQFKRSHRRGNPSPSLMGAPKPSPVALLLTLQGQTSRFSFQGLASCSAPSNPAPPPCSLCPTDWHQLISYSKQRSHFMLWLLSKICAPESTMRDRQQTISKSFQMVKMILEISPLDQRIAVNPSVDELYCALSFWYLINSMCWDCILPLLPQAVRNAKKPCTELYVH